MNAGCPFCQRAQLLMENQRTYVIRDKCPANAGHLLIVPRRHVGDWFETNTGERRALFELADSAKLWVERELHPGGYNLGINVGEAAGQTIFHVHLHLIPRYRGDISDPRGGVRGVIPSKQSY